MLRRHVRGRAIRPRQSQPDGVGRRAVVIGSRRQALLLLLPVATGAVELQRGAREGSSRENSAPFMTVAAAAVLGLTWTLTRATFGRGQPRSSFSSRSRVWSAWGSGFWRVSFGLRRALAEKKLNARLGSGLKNKGMPRGGGRAAGGSPEMAGLKRGLRSPGNKELRWLPRPFINCR